MHVFNAHLRAPLAAHLEGQKLSTGVWRSTAAWAEGFYLAALQRNGQALEMRLAVDRLLSTEPDARVIVCGDLNADLNEMPVRLLCASETDTGNPALAGRALHAVDRALVSTSSEGCDVASRADERHYMLDHVLASKSLAAACTRVWMPVGEPAWPSDHPPLLAVFEI